jgi:hypothetical protein
VAGHLGCCTAGLLVTLAVTRPLTLEVLAKGAADALAFPLGFATIGLVVSLRRPANPIGWLYAAARDRCRRPPPIDNPSGWRPGRLRRLGADLPRPGLACGQRAGRAGLCAAAVPSLTWGRAPAAALGRGRGRRRRRRVAGGDRGGTLGIVPALAGVLIYPALLCMPVAVALAVLRYRLWDLDRLVSRTVTYALLTGLLVAPYLFILPAVSRLAGGAGSLAVATATLAAAAMFQPLRRWVQGWVDRRFNRRCYNAARTVEGFSGRLRDKVDLDTLSAELLAVVDQTMQPTAVSLWLRPPA